MGARCFWDENTDNYAQEVFMNVRNRGATVLAVVSGVIRGGVNRTNYFVWLPPSAYISTVSSAPSRMPAPADDGVELATPGLASAVPAFC
jgi:hypothetical protein